MVAKCGCGQRVALVRGLSQEARRARPSSTGQRIEHGPSGPRADPVTIPSEQRGFVYGNRSTCRGRRSSKPLATAVFSAVYCTVVRSAELNGIHCFQAVKMSVYAFQAGCRGFESRLPLHAEFFGV